MTGLAVDTQNVYNVSLFDRHRLSPRSLADGRLG